MASAGQKRDSEKKKPVQFEIPASKEVIHGVVALRVFDSETQEEGIYLANLRNPITTDKIGLLKSALIRVEQEF